MVHRSARHILLGILFLFPSFVQAQTEAQIVSADVFIRALVQRDWERLEALEHYTLRDKITSAQWGELIDQLEQQGGTIQRHEFFSAEANGSYASVVYRLHMEKDSIGLRVVVDSMNLIGGFWIDPIKKDYRFPLPAYVDTTVFTEVDATIGDEFSLPARFSIPKGKGPFPAVVLVHGSGPSDMDETIAGNKIFRDIAWGLASKGIMVLRYVKRSKQHGKGMNIFKITVQEETIDDAIAAMALISTRPEADKDRLILLGHSLGAALAPEIAAHSPGVDGVIMLAPIARPLEVVIADQLRFIASTQDSLSAEEKTKLKAELDKSAKIQSGELMKGTRLLGMPASYFYDLQKRDQKGYAEKLGIPMFIARGTKDYQAPQMEMVLWKQWLKEKTDVTFRTYKDCYHLFIETDASPGPWNYQQEGNVTPLLIDDLVSWCREFRLSDRSE
jgi:dienelactone hydrolase